MRDNNFFKELINAKFPQIGEEVSEALALMLIKEGYLDPMENRHFEISNFYNSQIEFYLSQGDSQEDSEMKSKVDACDCYKISSPTLWRIRKKFERFNIMKCETVK